MKQSITVDLTKIPHKIEALNQIALSNKGGELSNKIWDYLQFIDGMEPDLELYLGINAFAVRNGINLNELVSETDVKC